MDGINFVQVGGMLVAIIASAAVAKQQLKTLSNSVDIIYKKISDLTSDIDVLQQKDSATETSINTFRDILSPTNLETRAREIEGLQNRINALRRDTDSLMHIHNSVHPAVNKDSG